MKQIGISKIDERNRTYIPESVTNLLKIDGGNNWLSWEEDDGGQILFFKGHLRYLLTKNGNKQQTTERKNKSE